MKKFAGLILLSAIVLIGGCKAEQPDTPERITSEAEHETSALDENEETAITDSNSESPHAETEEAPVRVFTEEIIPVESTETAEPIVIPPIYDDAEYYSETSFFEGEIEDERQQGKLYFGLTVPFGLELTAAGATVLDGDSSIEAPYVYAGWTVENLTEEYWEHDDNDGKSTVDVSKELTNDGENFYLMVERSFEDSALTRFERSSVSGLYPLERGYFQWIYYCYDEAAEREFISDASNSLRSVICSPTYFEQPTADGEYPETAEPQSEFGFTVKLPEDTILIENNTVNYLPNTELDSVTRAISEGGAVNITVTELSGSSAWEHALTCAENVREELDIEGVPPEKLQELESSEDRIIILKKTPLVKGYLYTVSGFYKRDDGNYTALFAFVSGENAEDFEQELTELAASFEFKTQE